VFATDKSPADGTSVAGGRASASADNTLHPTSAPSDPVQSFPESPAKLLPAEQQSTSNADVPATDRVVASPSVAVSTGQSSGHDAGTSNGDAQK